MSNQSHYPVVIIGAGPVGVTAATLLAQYGITSLVLDRWAGLYPQPRAVHLDDEVYRILERLGIASEFAQISRPAVGLRLLDSEMSTVVEFRRDPTIRRHGHPQANMFDQPRLEALLRANLASYSHATLRGDAEVTDLTDLRDGRTRITFTDRSDDSVHAVECDYLLGCDGANSMVRKHIGTTMRDYRFEQRWLVVDVDSAVDLQQWDGVHQVCDPRRAGTFMQVGDTRYRWEFQLLPGESADDFATLRSLRPLITPWLQAGPSDDDLRLIRVAEYTFRARLAERWRRGNSFLLGDAAHLTPPFIGQGLCAGLRDAMNLSWKLAGVINGDLAADALETYEVERKPHARKMLTLALAIGFAMSAGGRIGSALRNIVAPRARLIPGLSAKILDSRTPPLSGSTLVQRSRGPGALAGDLCPNAVTAHGERLDGELGTGFAIITAVAPTAGQRQLIEQRHAIVHHAVPGTELARWLDRGRARAAIVRPDFTVMRAGRDLSALCEALPAFDLSAQTR